MTEIERNLETTSHDQSNDDRTEAQSRLIEKEISSPNNDSTSSYVSEGNSVESTNDSILDSAEDPNFVTATTFKKPAVLTGPKRFRPVSKTTKTSLSLNQCSSENSDRTTDHLTKPRLDSKDPPFPYVEPAWGGKSEQDYKLEVLKSGVIVETILLKEQSFYIVGRLPSCHVSLAHPTISRYHAVLQYRSREDGENLKGFYVYDLGSTQGTFWNGHRIKPNVYVRIRGGHILRFGCSLRKYIVQAPPHDQEEESLYTLSELKEMRALELEKQRMNTEPNQEEENDGIDWGMGEDADEETDLQENPYACIADEDLVLDDPKKTLRGWFEREGYDLQYQTEEKGIGQFLCWVDLPIEDIVGHAVRAEAIVKGKKKEAVVQCALEACKILDKYGLLRQANHEARKRKTRNWEAEDYYDSDEDNFLDRTGSVEKKREQRMRLAGKLEDKAETYDSLLEKHKQVTKRISHLSNSIENWQNANSIEKETTDEDALDAFMSSLNSSALTKSDIAKMKVELQNLRKEEASLTKLLNLTRPANLPALVSTNAEEMARSDKVAEKATRQVSSEANKIQDSLFRRRKEKQANKRTYSNRKSIVTSTTDGIGTEAELEEELDSDDNSEQILNSSRASSTEETCESQNFTVSIGNDMNESLEVNEEKQSQRQVDATKKRRQERKKINYGQDIDTANYSTWVPPQDQAGDGKTSLNEKYGY
nr:PREDICTED: kanadaptin isoform X1 [Megachile rotundata]